MGLGERRQIADRPRVRGAWRAEPADAGQIAWLAVIPCTIAVVLAVVLLGPVLGRTLPHGHTTPWPSVAAAFRPEPTERARYALVLTLPLLLVGSMVLASRRRIRVFRSVAWAVAAVQVLGVVFVVVCIAAQRRARFEAAYTAVAGTSPRTVYFTVVTLLVATVIGLAAAFSARSAAVRRLTGELSDTRSRRVAAWTTSLVAIAISLLPALELEGTLLRANVNTWYHLTLTLDEAFAVLDGRSPLVDFASLYGSLWPYALAAVMSALGSSIGVFTLLATLAAGAALLSLFAVLRRVTRNAAMAVLLFLPLLATSLYMMRGSPANRYSLATVTAMFPLRLAGPCLLLWLTVRHLDGARPRARWPLFPVAGLVVLNNVEFGVPALAATLAALLWTARAARPASWRLVAELLGGLASAYALVAAVTLARADSLPHLELAVRSIHLYADSGFCMLPIVPTIGVSTIVLMTFGAAIGAATARAIDRAPDQLHTSALVWSGVFGLGVGAYYVGRSHPEVLINVFPAWALSLVLLTIAVLRDAGSSGRLPGPAAVACLIGFGVLVCSLAQTPAPWTQARRLSETTPQRIVTPEVVRYVARHTHAGEPVASLMILGHRVAALAGVTNVTPYTGLELMPTQEQLDDTLRMLAAAGGKTVIAPVEGPMPEMVQAAEDRGYRLTSLDSRVGLLTLSRR